VASRDSKVVQCSVVCCERRSAWWDRGECRKHQNGLRYEKLRFEVAVFCFRISCFALDFFFAYVFVPEVDSFFLEFLRLFARPSDATFGNVLHDLVNYVPHYLAFMGKEGCNLGEDTGRIMEHEGH